MLTGSLAQPTPSAGLVADLLGLADATSWTTSWCSRWRRRIAGIRISTPRGRWPRPGGQRAARDALPRVPSSAWQRRRPRHARCHAHGRRSALTGMDASRSGRVATAGNRLCLPAARMALHRLRRQRHRRSRQRHSLPAPSKPVFAGAASTTPSRSPVDDPGGDRSSSGVTHRRQPRRWPARTTSSPSAQPGPGCVGHRRQPANRPLVFVPARGVRDGFRSGFRRTRRSCATSPSVSVSSSKMASRPSSAGPWHTLRGDQPGAVGPSTPANDLVAQARRTR
jgi:hypothetical protein